MVQFKTLRLSGFKSFVDPTEVAIEHGITGIVGPNGCGKSNLVEALRWVMGENSPKRMRGGEMDDVIFAGNANRPSRNLAEVVVALDNSDRKAPAQFNDHDELEVSRQIERGSGSTYRVNGREVRARDVQLLFADAATGAHSTALVSQGRVGALINAKPKDRRALLEEAAGITGLHSRRHEAELRLRAAETNLERLDDVVSTMESQLQGLKRQARQASRYRNIAGHIRRNEAILLHLESLEGEERLARAKQQLAEAEGQVATTTEAVALASTEQAEAAAALPGLRETEAAAAAARQRLLVDRENLEREEAQVAAAQIQANQRLEQIDSDQGRIRAQAEDAGGALTRLEEERRALAMAAEGEQQEQEQARARLAEASEAVAEKDEGLTRLTGQVAADEARRSALERRAAELTGRLERLRGESEELARQQRGLRDEQDQGDRLSDAAAALAQAEAALEERRGESENAERELTSRREAEQQSREALQALESAQSGLAAEIAALSKLLESGEPEIWPPLIDALTVEPGLEVALGAALGDDLTAPTDEAAPLHWETLAPFAAAPALPEGVPALTDFVAGPDALQRRLSQIGLVADSASGDRLQGQLHQGQRLVTQDGGLWRWDGFVVRAGTPTAAAQRLEQHNRLKELRRSRAAAADELDAARNAFAEAREAAGGAAEQERAARGALREAYGEVDARRTAHSELARRAAELSSRLSALEERSQRLTAEIEDGEGALVQTRRELGRAARSGRGAGAPGRAARRSGRAARARGRVRVRARQSLARATRAGRAPERDRAGGRDLAASPRRGRTALGRFG